MDEDRDPWEDKAALHADDVVLNIDGTPLIAHEAILAPEDGCLDNCSEHGCALQPKDFHFTTDELLKEPDYSLNNIYKDLGTLTPPPTDHDNL